MCRVQQEHHFIGCFRSRSNSNYNQRKDLSSLTWHEFHWHLWIFMNVFDPSSNDHGMVVPGLQPKIHAHDTKNLGKSFCNQKQWEKAKGILSRLKRLRSFVSIQQKCWTATSFVSLCFVKAARNSGTCGIYKTCWEVNKWKHVPWVQWVEVKVKICKNMLEKRISQISPSHTGPKDKSDR